MVPTSPAFSVNQGITLGRTILTTVALTTTEQPQVTTNLSVQSKSVDHAERRDILLPTALSMTIGMTMTSLRMRDMLGTESVTQGNERDNVMVFLFFFFFILWTYHFFFH